jgi:hypothetical protein
MIMTGAMKSALCDDFMDRFRTYQDRKARGVAWVCAGVGPFVSEMSGDQSEYLIFELAERLFIAEEALKVSRRNEGGTA